MKDDTKTLLMGGGIGLGVYALSRRRETEPFGFPSFPSIDLSGIFEGFTFPSIDMPTVDMPSVTFPEFPSFDIPQFADLFPDIPEYIDLKGDLPSMPTIIYPWSGVGETLKGLFSWWKTPEWKASDINILGWINSLMIPIVPATIVVGGTILDLIFGGKVSAAGSPALTMPVIPMGGKGAYLPTTYFADVIVQAPMRFRHEPSGFESYTPQIRRRIPGT